MTALRCAALTLVFSTLAAPAAAQGRPRSYAFVGPGLAAFEGEDLGMTLQGGIGLDARFDTGTAVGIEVNYVMPAVDNWSSGFGVLSPGVFQFFRTGRRVTPFAGGGVSLFFAGGGAALGLNIGAGVEVVKARRASLRVEVRDQMLWGGGSDAHFVSLRIGASFR